MKKIMHFACKNHKNRDGILVKTDNTTIHRPSRQGRGSTRKRQRSDNLKCTHLQNRYCILSFFYYLYSSVITQK
jgi:hypothetical protein